MDLLQLTYFLTVARLEHITKSAAELNIAQPSLSQTIARLEEDLGFPLFERQGRNIRLNESGKAFLERVERAFFELQEGKREAKDKAGLKKEAVALGTIHLQAMPDFIGQYFSLNSQISFRLHQGCNNSMRLQIERGEIDLCISSPLLHHSGIKSVPLMTEEIVIMVPPGHRLAGQRSVLLSEMSKDAFICLKDGYGLREATDEFCRQAGFKPRIVLEVEDPTVLQQLVKEGIGIAFIPSLLWKADATLANEVLRIEAPVCRRTIGLAWKEKRNMSSVVGEFKQYLIEYFAKLEHSINP